MVVGPLEEVLFRPQLYLVFGPLVHTYDDVESHSPDSAGNCRRSGARKVARPGLRTQVSANVVFIGLLLVICFLFLFSFFFSFFFLRPLLPLVVLDCLQIL